MNLHDSGKRHEFLSGAVRDMQEGKGRCDLLPIGVCASLLGKSGVLNAIDLFMLNPIPDYSGYLLLAYKEFIQELDMSAAESFLEVAHHFEDGARKYGDNNWRKGIPINCYIDSAVRHYLKWRAGYKDEPHQRAVMWNLLCAIWTMDNILASKN